MPLHGQISKSTAVMARYNKIINENMWLYNGAVSGWLFLTGQGNVDAVRIWYRNLRNLPRREGLVAVYVSGGSGNDWLSRQMCFSPPFFQCGIL